MSDSLKLYAVQSPDGRWLRSKGYNGSGESWVESPQKAKYWANIGPAKAQITWWAANTKLTGELAPKLVVLTMAASEVIDWAATGMAAKIKRDIAKKEARLKYIQKSELNRIAILEQELATLKAAL